MVRSQHGYGGKILGNQSKLNAQTTHKIALKQTLLARENSLARHAEQIETLRPKSSAPSASLCRTQELHSLCNEKLHNH